MSSSSWSSRKPSAEPADLSPEAAHAAALDILSKREHSRRELARKLRRRRFPRDVIDSVLERLERVGLVSDDRYARLFVRDRLAIRPQARRRIVQGLRAKGVAPEVAVRAVAEIHGEEGSTERETAEALARRRWRVLHHLQPQVARRRLLGYLARRGYAGSVVADVVRQVMGEASRDTSTTLSSHPNV